jgi:hypothetical protein
MSLFEPERQDRWEVQRIVDGKWVTPSEAFVYQDPLVAYDYARCLSLTAPIRIIEISMTSVAIYYPPEDS